MSAKIPVASTDLGGNEERYVVDAIRSSWISSTGPYLSRFEREYAAACGASSAVAVCNGTVALHLALLGLDVRPGDEVLVPSLTYVATANAVRYVGAEPVFVDVDRETWCLDPAQIEAAITRRTKGIIVVHLLGHPADMDRINHIAAVNGLWVVEDAAEAPLATYKGRVVGGLAKMATFSFFGNKILTCGEGGAITLNDPQLDTRLRILRGQGMDPQRRYYFPVTGYNFRLTNVAAAILCASWSGATRSSPSAASSSTATRSCSARFAASASSRSPRGRSCRRGCSRPRWTPRRSAARATSWPPRWRSAASRRGRCSTRCTSCRRSARSRSGAANTCRSRTSWPPPPSCCRPTTG